MLIKAFLRIILLVAPATLLSGIAVHWFRSFLFTSFDIQVVFPVYQLILLVVMWAAMWFTAKPILDELKSRKNHVDQPK